MKCLLVATLLMAVFTSGLDAGILYWTDPSGHQANDIDLAQNRPDWVGLWLDGPSEDLVVYVQRVTGHARFLNVRCDLEGALKPVVTADGIYNLGGRNLTDGPPVKIASIRINPGFSRSDLVIFPAVAMPPVHITNVTIHGVDPTPEPPTLLLALAALAVGPLWRARRRSALPSRRAR